MLKAIAKGLVVAVTSAFAIPYTVAIICNVLYGWPRKNRFQRAFHPVKVYNLNYTVLQHLMRIRYLGLLMKWKRVYKKASSTRLLKDIPYGSNDNALDMYFPKQPQEGSSRRLLPVVVFVYGGSWSSGDKNMYALLCTHLADQLHAIVCCLNYSIYPQGYVDDMIQDVVDSLSWIQTNITHYGGDKTQVMLVGHSAGAHLCLMSVLELTMKQTLHDPGFVSSLTSAASATYNTQSQADSFHFEESHFNGNRNNSNEDQQKLLSESQMAPMAFYVGNGAGENETEDGNHELVASSQLTSRQSSTSTDPLAVSKDSSFFVVEEAEDESETMETERTVAGEEEEEKQESEYLEKTVLEAPSGGGESVSVVGRGFRADEEAAQEATSRDEATVERSESDQSQAPHVELTSKAQRDVHDIMTSIKAVIGLAGVYDIADHYEHEATRGIEDISYMHRAMYDPEHFDRFSPTVIVGNMAAGISLPYIHLMHGNKDKIVPVSSTVKLFEALERTATDVTVKIIADCNHLEICLDLMTTRGKHFHTVMDSIRKTANKVFS